MGMGERGICAKKKNNSSGQVWHSIKKYPLKPNLPQNTKNQDQNKQQQNLCPIYS